MGFLEIEELLILLCSVVVVSYIFSIISRVIRVPSVLLLLFAGIGIRSLTDAYDIMFLIPDYLIQALGVVGLIMIVLEAGLDLKLTKDKIPVIRSSFFSALIIFILSAVLLTTVLKYWLDEPVINCLVYAIPLSIISSSIVIPSLHSLTEEKKEFLVYEASFSDILGILVFNYFTAREFMTAKSLGIFAGSLVFSIFLSLVLSLVLLFIMSRTQLNIKFFLIFSLLILIYATGKILHLPSLLIILAFGLMINNWEQIQSTRLLKYFPRKIVVPLREVLHSLTAETSFIVRTFFFILFGFSIQLNFLAEKEVVLVGSLIVLALFIIRFLYLRFFLATNIFPELFFMPRGLITIVLFYKIPDVLKMNTFNEGILFFVILTTGVIMTLGMVLYRKKPGQIIEEGQFRPPGYIQKNQK